MRDDVRARQGGRLYHPMSPMQRRSPGGALRSPQSASRRAVADMRSIFVGNLPSDVTEALLFDMFLMFGTILHIDIVQKPSADR